MKVIEMNGRDVLSIPIDEGLSEFFEIRKCADCGQEARLIIIEKIVRVSSAKLSHIWGYCGVCDIGG